jgi:uncharacterized damage-inducible protein DinB
MKKVRLLVMALLAVPVAQPPLAQEAPKDAPSQRAIGASAAVLKQWNEIGRKLIAMAQDFPEGKYDFKPIPTAGSFAERLIHAAAANYFFTNLALGQKAPGEEDPPRAQFKNKAAVVAYVRKSFADGAAAIQSKGDNGMSASVADPFAHRQVRLADLAYGVVEHSGEVYGQLAVYYRVAGLIPPESRPKK